MRRLIHLSVLSVLAPIVAVGQDPVVDMGWIPYASVLGPTVVPAGKIVRFHFKAQLGDTALFSAMEYLPPQGSQSLCSVVRGPGITSTAQSCSSGGTERAISIVQSGDFTIDIYDSSYNFTTKNATQFWMYVGCNAGASPQSCPAPTSGPAVHVVAPKATLVLDQPRLNNEPVRSSDPFHLYSLSVTQGSSYAVKATERSTASICLLGFNTTGVRVPIGSSSCSSMTMSGTFSATKTGTYQFLVYRLGFGGDMTYEIEATCSSPPCQPPPCTYSIAPTSQNFGADGGAGSVAISTGAGCAWTATVADQWINLSSAASGSGNATLSYSVARNATTVARSGKIDVAGQSLTVTQAGAALPDGGLTADPAAVRISVPQGARGAQNRQVVLTSATAGLRFSARAQGAAWLSAEGTGRTPANLSVSVNTANLAEGTHTGSIVITSLDGLFAPVQVPVTVQVTRDDSLKLKVDQSPVDIAAPARSLEKTYEVRSAANLTSSSISFEFRITTETGDRWLSASLQATDGRLEIAPGDERQIQVAVDPSQLRSAADDRGLVELYASSVKLASIPVALRSRQTGRGRLEVPQRAVSFVVGPGANLSREVVVVNRGDGALRWRVQTELPWVVLPLPEESVVAGGFRPIPFSINGAAVPAQLTTGELRVTDKDASADNEDSSKTVTIQTRSVANPLPAISPLSRIFLYKAGDSGFRCVTNPTLPDAEKQACDFSLTRPLVSGSNLVTSFEAKPVEVLASPGQPKAPIWYQLSTESGQFSSAASATQRVALRPEPAVAQSLTPGFYFGQIEVKFSGSERQLLDRQIIDVILQVEQPTGTAAIKARAAGADCVVSTLQMTLTSLEARFRVTAGVAAPLVAQVVDGCGSPVTDAIVTVGFSNGDPSIRLTSLGGGTFAGIWQPNGSPNADVSLDLNAQSPQTGRFGQKRLSGAVLPNPGFPLQKSAGVINAAGSSGSGLVSPGMMVTLYGEELAGGTEQATGFPLPTSLAGTSVRVGQNRELALTYVSPTQINGVLPYDLLDSQVDLVVRRSDRLSVPAAVTVRPYLPAIFVISNPGGPIAAIVDQNGRLITDSNPARKDSIITIFASGLGAVQPVVSHREQVTGVHRTVVPVGVIVGRGSAEVLFGGLAPGFSGLYQVNVRVPRSAPSGRVQITLTVGETRIAVSNAVEIPIAE